MLPQLMILLEDDLPGALPKSDQHQFSPQTINTYCKEKVMRITKMVTLRKML